jgi:hypothetical protein
MVFLPSPFALSNSHFTGVVFAVDHGEFVRAMTLTAMTLGCFDPHFISLKLVERQTITVPSDSSHNFMQRCSACLDCELEN